MIDSQIPDGFYKDKYGCISKKECTCGKINCDVDNCNDCKNIEKIGWICPNCKKGNNPSNLTCPCTLINQLKNGI